MKSRCKHGNVNEVPVKLTFCVVLFASLLTVGCTNTSKNPMPDTHDAPATSPASSESPENVDDARNIARAAFKRSTEKEIIDYSVELVRVDSDAWRFLVKGEGEYARPGFHWLVSVSRLDGSVTIVPGE
jgi:hypothetical protein